MQKFMTSGLTALMVMLLTVVGVLPAFALTPSRNHPPVAHACKCCDTDPATCTTPSCCNLPARSSVPVAPISLPPSGANCWQVIAAHSSECVLPARLESRLSNAFALSLPPFQTAPLFQRDCSYLI